MDKIKTNKKTIDYSAIWNWMVNERKDDIDGVVKRLNEVTDFEYYTQTSKRRPWERHPQSGSAIAKTTIECWIKGCPHLPASMKDWEKLNYELWIEYDWATPSPRTWDYPGDDGYFDVTDLWVEDEKGNAMDEVDFIGLGLVDIHECKPQSIDCTCGDDDE